MGESTRKPRRKAEEALARSLQFFEQVFQQTEAGLFLFDADDNFVRVNNAFAHIFGYEPHEMEGRHGSLIISPEDIEMNARRLEALKRGETPGPREFSPIAKDGSRRYVRSSPTRVLNLEGQQLFLGTVIDITERKQAEDRLRESEARFRQVADENARLFEAEHERSRQLSLAIQETHHRVKNNLQAVSALLELQITTESGVLPVEAVRGSLSQIKAIAIVHDLLSHDQPIGYVDAAQALRKLVHLFPEQVSAGPDPVEIALEAEPIWIPTKAATALALVVNELLTNAIKHGGAGRMGPSEPQNAIEVHLRKQDGMVLLSVTDGGPGFPPGFDPVQHAHLGLELVRALVESDLQGAVRFLNRPAQNLGAQPGGRVEIIFPEHALPE